MDTIHRRGKKTVLQEQEAVGQDTRQFDKMEAVKSIILKTQDTEVVGVKWCF